eukprot:gene4848-5483_t
MSQPPPYSQQQVPPPQQTGYGQPPATTTPQQTQHTVVMAQSVITVPRIAFNTFPVQITCPRCQANVMTAVTMQNGLMVWLSVGGICLFGGWLGCCLIPFCVDAFKDAVHTCPNCHNVVGTFKRA